MSTAAAVTSGSSPSLTIKRRFNAPPAKVFAAWTDPEKIARWMGPAGVLNVVAECDARPGGGFRVQMVMPDDTHDVSGVYREFVPNEKLVFSWAWRTMPERASQVTVTFKPDGDGTLMTLLHEQFFDEAARENHQRGWTEIVGKLDVYLTEGSA